MVETKTESVTDHIPVAATLSTAHGSQDREICRITKPADSRKAYSQLDNNNYRHYSQNKRTDLRLSKDALSMRVKEQAAKTVCVCVCPFCSN